MSANRHSYLNKSVPLYSLYTQLQIDPDRVNTEVQQNLGHHKISNLRR